MEDTAGFVVEATFISGRFWIGGYRNISLLAEFCVRRTSGLILTSSLFVLRGRLLATRDVSASSLANAMPLIFGQLAAVLIFAGTHCKFTGFQARLYLCFRQALAF